MDQGRRSSIGGPPGAAKQQQQQQEQHQQQEQQEQQQKQHEQQQKQQQQQQDPRQTSQQAKQQPQHQDWQHSAQPQTRQPQQLPQTHKREPQEALQQQQLQQHQKQQQQQQQQHYERFQQQGQKVEEQRLKQSVERQRSEAGMQQQQDDVAEQQQQQGTETGHTGQQQQQDVEAARQQQPQEEGELQRKQPRRQCTSMGLPPGSEVLCQAAGIELSVSPAEGETGPSGDLAAASPPSTAALSSEDSSGSGSSSSGSSSSGSNAAGDTAGGGGEGQETGSASSVSSLAPPPVAAAAAAPAAAGGGPAAAAAAAARGRRGGEETEKAMPRDCSGSVSWRLSDSVFRQRVRAICARAVTEPAREGPGSVPPASEAAAAAAAAHARHSSTNASSNTCSCYRIGSSGTSGTTGGLAGAEGETPHSRRGRSRTLGREELRARAQQIEQGASTALETPNLLDEVQYVRYKLANKALCIFLVRRRSSPYEREGSGLKTELCFQDYDGTLTPIVGDPREARMSDAFRDTLKRLAAVYPVAIVTGRRLETIRSFVRLPDDPGRRSLMYAASHGFDIDATGFGLHIRHQVGETSVSALRAAVATILAMVGPIKGLYVEDNYFAVSIHYRHCPDSRPALEKAVDSVLQDYPGLCKCLGLELLDIRIAAQWDKGSAIAWILEALGLNGNSKELGVVYVGDDLTDEDAFRVVRAFPSGLPVVVSPRNRGTLATLHLDNVYEVRLFLEALVHFPCNSALTELRNGNANIALHRTQSAAWQQESSFEGLPSPADGRRGPPHSRRRAGSLTLHVKPGRSRHHRRRLARRRGGGLPPPFAAAAAAPAAAPAAAEAPVSSGPARRRHRCSKRGVQSEGGAGFSSAATSDGESATSVTATHTDSSIHPRSSSSSSSSRGEPAPKADPLRSGGRAEAADRDTGGAARRGSRLRQDVGAAQLSAAEAIKGHSA
ncbi:hypothetical protein Efla_007473 [Eimeria flavescens]